MGTVKVTEQRIEVMLFLFMWMFEPVQQMFVVIVIDLFTFDESTIASAHIWLLGHKNIWLVDFNKALTCDRSTSRTVSLLTSQLHHFGSLLTLAATKVSQFYHSTILKFGGGKGCDVATSPDPNFLKFISGIDEKRPGHAHPVIIQTGLLVTTYCFGTASQGVVISACTPAKNWPIDGITKRRYRTLLETS